MKHLLLLLAALGLASCTTDKGAQTGTAAVTELPFSSGPRTVTGAEVIALRGASVTVERVVYLNSPCPAGAQCIHSGVERQVQFTVNHTMQTPVTVVADSTQVVDGVELKVHEVRAGPQADIEVSLPVQQAK